MANDGSVVIGIEGDDSKFKKTLGGLGSIASGALRGVTVAVGAASTAIAGMAAGAVKVGSEFESALAGTSTMFGDVAVDTDNLTSKILELSNSTGTAASDITGSLYNALSAGIPVTEDMGSAMDYMEESIKLAKAGFTDVDTAVTSTAKVLNAYKMDVSKTADIHKILIQTQNKGITTVGELGASLAQVTPTAAAMSVGFDQVGASLASMTAQGTPTAQATTQLNSLFAEMGKQGTQAQKGLDAALKGTEYAGKSFQELMEEGVPLNEVLNTMDSYAQDNGKSMLDMFSSIEAGKAALALSGQNSQQFTDNLAAMATQSDVVGDAYTKATDTLQTKTQMLKESISNLGIAVYDGMEEPLKNAASTATDMIGQITAAFKEGGLTGAVEAVGDVFAQLVSKVAELAPKMIDAGVQLLQSFLKGIRNNLSSVSTGAVNIVSSLTNGIVALLPDLADTAIQLIVSLVEGIGEALPQLIPAAVQAISTLVQGLIDNLPLLIQAALQLILGLVQGLIDAIPVLIAAIPTIINSLIDALLGSIPQIIQAGIDLLTALVGALPEIITAIVEAIPKIIDGIITALIENIPLIIQAGIDLLIALIQALPEIITAIVDAIPQIIEGICNALIGNIDKIILAGVQLFIALIENLPTIIIEICKAVPQIIAGIVNAFGSLMGKIVELGGNLLKGIWEGIKNAGAWLWEKISGFFGGIVDKVKGFFGIHSPSKVFADIGGNTMEGFAAGVEDEAGDTEKRVLSTVGDLSDNMTDALGSGGDAAGGSLMSDLAASASAGVEGIREIADNAADVFCDTFMARHSDYYDVGINAMAGLNSGLIEQGKVAIASARRIANSIISEMQRALDIHSPSRKLRDLVGIPAARGLLQGFEDGMDDFGRRMRSAVDAETGRVSANMAAQAEGRNAANQVVREVHTNTRTVERVAQIEGDGITGELIRMLGLRLKEDGRLIGTSLVVE